MAEIVSLFYCVTAFVHSRSTLLFVTGKKGCVVYNGVRLALYQFVCRSSARGLLTNLYFSLRSLIIIFFFVFVCMLMSYDNKYFVLYGKCSSLEECRDC